MPGTGLLHGKTDSNWMMHQPVLHRQWVHTASYRAPFMRLPPIFRLHFRLEIVDRKSILPKLKHCDTEKVVEI